MMFRSACFSKVEIADLGLKTSDEPSDTITDLLLMSIYFEGCRCDLTENFASKPRPFMSAIASLVRCLAQKFAGP